MLYASIFNFTVERAFKGERVHDIEFPEYNNSPSRFFRFFDPETAPGERKDRIFVAAKQGNDSELRVLYAPLLFVVFVGTPIKKRVLLSRVAMKITKESHLALPLCESNHLLSIKDSLMEKLVRRLPLAIEIAA